MTDDESPTNVLTDGGSASHVRARGLIKRFGGFTAVAGVDFELSGSGITSFIGPNGAGKTTLFNLITGQLVPDEGNVWIGDHDVTGRPARAIARLGVGRGFQDVRLFPSMSVLANVMVYAQPSDTANPFKTAGLFWRQRRIAADVRDVALERLQYLGIESLRDVEAGRLGFAQQKLVAIARLLALQPRILFLDEPASGLDNSGVETLASTIERLAADGYPVVFIEHNTQLVRRLATRVLFLAGGRILADGSADEVFTSAVLAEAYLGIS